MKVSIKKYFFRRKILNYYDIYSEVVFSNGKTVKLYFNSSKHSIEIVYEKQKDILSAEERAMLIELILKELCTFFRGIIHFSLGEYIENYTLIDIIWDKKYISKNTILIEYFNSEYSKKTKEKLFNILRDIYVQINLQKEKIGQDVISINLKKNLKYTEKIDVIYFSKYFVTNSKGNVKFNFSKNNSKILQLIPVS